MRFTLNLLLLLTFCTSALFAQKKELKVKFGKISDEEMNMKSYPRDPSAPAVVLFDKGRVSHRFVESRGFVLEYERHTRIKIFSKEATNLADVAIFHFSSQKINDLKASSYNLENGKIVESNIGKDNVFEEKLTRSRMVQKITIPAVREGSVIEYRYTITDDGGVGIQDWLFQREDIPTIWSEYEASVPTFIQFRKMSQGWEPFTLVEENTKNDHVNINYTTRSDGYVTTTKSNTARVEYTCNNLHFIQENLPALKPEAFVHSVRDYLSRISFDVQAVYDTDLVPMAPGTYRLENTSFRERNVSWEKLGLEMLEDVYDDLLKSSKYTEAEAQKCVAGKAAGAEQVAAIYAFIGQNYQNNGSDYLWPSQNLDELAKNRKGTPTDLNLLLINMLRRAGLKAYPLLLSTRKHGRVVSFRVSTEAFNRVIAAVETGQNELLLLDAAGWPHPLGLLPEEDLNGEGLLLKDAQTIGWIPVQNPVLVRQAVVANLDVLPDGGLKGDLTFTETGYGAVEGRAKIKGKDHQLYVQEKFKTLLADGKCSDLKIEKAEQWHETELKGTFQLETAAYASGAGDKIYLQPPLGFGLHENPFKNPERKFNIELGTPRSLTLSFSFNIPPGYKVEEAPKAAKMSFGENALSFQYLIEHSPENIKVVIRQNIKNPYITSEQYPALKQFFADWVSKMEEQVVLTKI